MSFDNFQLAENIISELYKDSVFILEDSQSIQPSLETDAYKHLGGFEKSILILVTDHQNTWLSDADMNLLTAILNACRLNMNDIAIANVDRLNLYPVDTYVNLMHPSKLLIFGTINTDLFQAHVQPFSIFQHHQMKWLKSPALSLLSQQPESKKALWISLKTMFEIQ